VSSASTASANAFDDAEIARIRMVAREMLRTNARSIGLRLLARYSGKPFLSSRRALGFHRRSTRGHRAPAVAHALMPLREQSGAQGAEEVP